MNKQEMKLEAGVPLVFGPVRGTAFGGQFRKYVPGTRRLVGIKMAQEIEHPYDFKVDTRDFSVPRMQDLEAGIKFGLAEIFKGNDLYVGCMGGVGRTGLYLACLTSVMIEYGKETIEGSPVDAGEGPVEHVRRVYNSHAVETNEQKMFVKDFNPTPFVEWLRSKNAKPEVVTKTVYLSPWDWLVSKFSGA